MAPSFVPSPNIHVGRGKGVESRSWVYLDWHYLRINVYENLLIFRT
jgi:hypothetical protein